MLDGRLASRAVWVMKSGLPTRQSNIYNVDPYGQHHLTQSNFSNYFCRPATGSKAFVVDPFKNCGRRIL
jgi:hypothetical protein